MNKTHLELQIQNGVLEKIREGRVRMRPRAFFVARLTITILVATLVLVISALVISFIFFSLHESGEQFLLGFGSNGIITFLLLFPWATLLLDIVALFVLEWLLQSFKFGYRVSLLSIFLGIFVCSTVLGFLVILTPLHRTLLNQADQGALPLIGEMYESIRDSHSDKGVFRGSIRSIQDNKIVLVHDDSDRDEDDGTRTIILPSQYPALNVGDRVYVFGTPVGEVIQARGIQKLSPEQ